MKIAADVCFVLMLIFAFATACSAIAYSSHKGLTVEGLLARRRTESQVVGGLILVVFFLFVGLTLRFLFA